MSKTNTALKVVANLAPATNEPAAPVGTVRDGKEYVATRLQNGETRYMWLPLSATTRTPAHDRIAELEAEVTRLEALFDETTSREDYDALQATKRDLDFERAQQVRRKAKAEELRRKQQDPDYLAELAMVDAEIAAHCKKHEELMDRAVALLLELARVTAEHGPVADAAYFATARRNDLRRSRGERVSDQIHSPVSAAFGRELLWTFNERCRALRIAAPNLGELLGL